MLSNTADTNPRPRAVGHDAPGSSLTGIIDAQLTRANRNTEPLNASGNSPQPGRRTGAVASSATHSAMASTGMRSASPGMNTLQTMFVVITAASSAPTTARRP